MSSDPTEGGRVIVGVFVRGLEEGWTLAAT